MSPSVCAPDCGDNFVFTAQGEACDDGGTASGDGCSSTCTIEPRWTCSIVNNRSVCTAAACGDGIRAGTEACDDGLNNSDEEPDACRTNCTVSRCGDGIEDTPELCDDGPWNGLPGLCTATCDGVGDEAINASTRTLDAAPSTLFGIFLSEATLFPLCIDVDVGNFGAHQAFLETHGFFAGRTITLTEDRIVRHPLLIADEGVFDGEPMYSAMSTSAEVGFGDFLVPAGTTLLQGIRGGGFVDNCCGTAHVGCTVEPLPPGGQPICGDSYKRRMPTEPGLVGVTCPQFDQLRAALFTAEGQASFNASCGPACFVASGEQCNTPPPPPAAEVHGSCAPADVSVSRACQVMSGVGSCPGMCEEGVSRCGSLDGDPHGTFDTCDLAAPGATQCDERGDDDGGGADDVVSLFTRWQRCQANPADGFCRGVNPPGHDDDIEMLVCNHANQGDCTLCSTAFGRGCVPVVDVPNEYDDGGNVTLDPSRVTTTSQSGPVSAAWLRSLNPKMQQVGAERRRRGASVAHRCAGGPVVAAT